MMIQKLQLPLQTGNLVVGFMVWVLISPLLVFMAEDIAIDPGKKALLTAIPVVLGSILRIPLGYYANVYGARWMFMLSFIALLFPVFYLSIADSVTDIVIAGLFLGVGGAVFSVGVTSLPKYYPKERHGFVNGVYGAGNIGTAVTSFAAPVLAMQIGWQATVQLYLILLALFALLNFFLGDKEEKKVRTPLIEQMKGVYKNEKMWFFCLFYFITFGSFVAFTVYLPNFLVSYFGLNSVDAGMRTAGFIVLATVMRPVGGWLGDKLQPLFLLMGVFTGITAAAIVLAFSPSIALYTIGCLVISFCAGIGNGVIFKLVPFYFNKQAGVVNGIVSMTGGLGGFFPPLMLASIFSITGQYSIGFMALSQVALASFILVVWLYFQDKLALSNEVFNSTAQGVLVTDASGTIQAVNPAFTELTGYSEEEVIGKNPNVLKSGKQPNGFYHSMWANIEKEGVWQGEIWNRRKSGEEFLEWLTISAVKDETGETIRYVGTFSDVTAHSPARRR